MDLQTFNHSYFYKTKLEEMCRQYQLPSYGTKAELQDYLTQYLTGVASKDIQPYRVNRAIHPSLKANEITTATRLLDSGFCLNHEARNFFKSYFDVPTFHFKKQMAVKMR